MRRGLRNWVSMRSRNLGFKACKYGLELDPTHDRKLIVNVEALAIVAKFSAARVLKRSGAFEYEKV